MGSSTHGTCSIDSVFQNTQVRWSCRAREVDPSSDGAIRAEGVQFGQPISSTQPEKNRSNRIKMLVENGKRRFFVFDVE